MGALRLHLPHDAEDSCSSSTNIDCAHRITLCKLEEKENIRRNSLGYGQLASVPAVSATLEKAVYGKWRVGRDEQIGGGRKCLPKIRLIVGVGVR
ncbi:hypothetical protein Y032_0093g2643 [Ancylostoma ceylanicum]|uniref:Uncharacterized protein n=1 Tax=Ancylostoma ceylanicum TaxID=53326 RepID=A0A016TLH4_9BILA|nr:hypothetical protein Y032_0093g2643 [Ancylostoma ceylanicum]